MTRLYGRSMKGERVNDYVPDIRFERQSIIAAIGVNGYLAPITFSGTLNGEFFGAYVSQSLAPAMKTGDTLILDNLSSHKVSGTLKPLIDKGIKVVFLPPYSPDFSPIKPSWSKVKSILRKLKARTKDDLILAVDIALSSITYSDATGWFQHCGYRVIS